jgi:predicted GNAT family acetyltransferase
VEINFRDRCSNDESFIFSSWIQSFRDINVLNLRTGKTRPDGKPHIKNIDTGPALWESDRYFKRQRDIVVAVLGASKTLVASNPEDPDQVYGYVVYRDYSPDIRVLSFLYVKHTFRKMGVAKALYEKIADCHVATHAGPSVAKLIRRVGLIYDPFFDYELIREGK